MKIPAFLSIMVITAVVSPMVSCQSGQNQKVVVGAEVLIRDHLQELEGRNIGLVMNPTARIGETHMLDTLLHLQVNIRALFAPEHGFRGDRGAGERIEDGIDQESGLPVFSLYGETRKPTPEMLAGIDLLIFDMQDVGARYYTYISTMGLVMEAASENNIEVWILDRPNPMGGEYISGWVLESAYTSFVGAYPIPVAHGLTMGELAHMAAGEGWLESEGEINFRVIAAENLDRSMLWPDTGLDWIPPSPNLPTFKHALVYLGTCFIEGTNLSEGRGTENPFLKIGSPTLQTDRIRFERLSERYGVGIRTIRFTPASLPGIAPNPKHLGTECEGIIISIDESLYASFDPVAFGIELLREVIQADEEAQIRDFLYLLAGTDRINEYLEAGNQGSPAGLWEEETEAFRWKRKPYLLY